MAGTSRRDLLATCACALICKPAVARVIQGALPWEPFRADPPKAVRPGPWEFFTPEEGADVEALVDRLIPPDADSPGGKDIGCAVFIDRQLAGAYGSSRGLYMRPPFMEGTQQQGMQSALTPAERYRASLAALDRHCRSAFAGKPFARIPGDRQDAVIRGLEDSSLQLQGVSGLAFFELLIKDTQHGFFADPIYGGNRDMAAWKLIGFPGARYDYRDWVERHNETYPLPPVGIQGRSAWNR